MVKATSDMLHFAQRGHQMETAHHKVKPSRKRTRGANSVNNGNNSERFPVRRNLAVEFNDRLGVRLMEECLARRGGTNIGEGSGEAGIDRSASMALKLFQLAAGALDATTSQDERSSRRAAAPSRSRADCYDGMVKKWRRGALSMLKQSRATTASPHSIDVTEALEEEMWFSSQRDAGPRAFSRNPFRMSDLLENRPRSSDARAVCAAAAFYNMGLLRAMDLNLPRAQACYRRALASLESVDVETLNTKGSILLMSLLNNVGTLEFTNGFHPASLRTFHRALGVGHGAMRRHLELKKEHDDNQSLTLELVRTLRAVISNVGRVYFQTGNLKESERFSRAALGLQDRFFDEEDADDEDLLGLAVANYNVGVMLGEKGDAPSAIEYVEKFLRHVTTVVSRQPEECSRRCIVLALHRLVQLRCEIGMYGENNVNDKTDEDGDENDDVAGLHECLADLLDNEGLAFDEPELLELLHRIGEAHLRRGEEEIAWEFCREAAFAGALVEEDGDSVMVAL